ncbi:T9SS type A sorting domain-containing protein [Neolewinella agarilytica]|uniref:DUF7619 domain-containing protein n=1 Tax=Neolewinella agarilytica TaxID=478744 RepID=UPI002355E108|nr:T9SS type A sorting domain-containing protein [Neolewinella agarilytica]
MKNYLTLLAFFLFATAIVAQEIPYTLEIVDFNTEPAPSRGLIDIKSDSIGAFIVEEIPLGDFVISFFDGNSLTELYRHEEEPHLHGVTDNGLFFSLPIPNQTWKYDLYFLKPGGQVNQISRTPIHTTKSYVFQNRLYHFSQVDGVRVFGSNNVSTLLSDEFSTTFTSDLVFEFGDQLVYDSGSGVYITNGTRFGTKEIFPDSRGDLLTYNNLLFYGNLPFDLDVYDPETGQVTDLTENLPNLPEGINVFNFAVASDQGVLFVGQSPTTGRELFITDGTKPGTSLLIEMVPGPEDGVSYFDFVGTTEGIGNQLVFGSISQDNTQQLWITDGATGGALPLLKLTGFDQINRTSIISKRHPDGGNILSVQERFGTSSNQQLYLYTDTLVELTDAGKSTFDDEILMLNNRVLVEEYENGFDNPPSLKSYGTTPEDVYTIGYLPNDNEIVLATPDALFFKGNDGEDAFDLLYTRGGVNDFNLFRRVGRGFDWDLVQPFTIGDILYFYFFDELYGEALYSARPDDSSPELMVNLYDNSVGRSPKGIFAIGGKLVVWYDDLRGEDRLLYGGTSTDVTTVSGSNIIGEPDQSILTVDDRHFFQRGRDVYEIDLSSGQIREVNINLPGDYSSFFWTAINQRLYRMTREYDLDLNMNIYALVEFDLLTETLAVIQVDTVDDEPFENLEMATDGEMVYFTYRTSSYSGPAYYNPSTGIITNLEGVDTNETLRYRRIGDNVALEVDSYFNTGPSYWLSPRGVGQELNVGVGSGETYNYPDHFLFLKNESDDLFSVDKSTGEAIQLSVAATWVTDIGNEEAIFFYDNFVTNEWELWETDGSEAGTKMILELNDLPFNGPINVQRWGDLVAIIPDYGELQLYNPATRQLETVDVELPGLSDGLVPIGNRLYFVANHPVFGTELHYLTLSGNNYISGEVFKDDNGNGFRDVGEGGIPNVRVEVAGGNITGVFTRQDGTFILGAAEGETYQFSLSSQPCSEFFSTPSSYSFNYNSGTEYQAVFGIVPTNDNPGLSVTLNSSTIRCGFEHDFWLTILNDGCQPLAGEGRVTFPEEMEFLDSDAVPLSQEENTLTFAFDTLQPNASQRFRIRFRMPDENFAGLPVELGAVAGAMTVDGAMVEADTFAYSQILRCAIDPNDKQVSPSRPEPSGSNYTQLDETLRYTIRFQNTGNDTAFTVRIQDKISESLNLETLKPLAASHPYSVSVRNDRTVVFLFEDILLPDSTTNLPGSQGFVTFEIQPFPDLDDFSTIDNTAGIYFDFNQPVITNTVTSTLVEFLDEDQDGFLFYEDCNDQNFDINPAAEEISGNGIDENCDDSDFPVSTYTALTGNLQAFPNPTTGELRLSYSGGTLLNGTLFSATGAKLQAFRFRQNHQLDLSALPAGLYLLQLKEPITGEGAVIKVIRE